MTAGALDIDIPSDHQGVLTVDLSAVAGNWRRLAAVAAPAACAAAVKADAYGTGVAEVVPALARAGCRTFFAAHVAEGARARTALRRAGFGDAAVRVFVLNGFHPDTAPPDLWPAFALSPVIGSGPELSAWTALGPARQGLQAAIHVDTGLNRLGFEQKEAARLDADTLAAAGATLLISHFVAAEEPDNPATILQIARFEALRRGPLGALAASLANSSGILLASRPHYDLVRPGYALYGGNPTPGRANPMRPVVALHATILQIRDVARGETAGYGGLWTAARPSRLATIGIGYADGLPRGARTVGGSDGPMALVGGTRCPLVGRVSMDLSLIDVTDAAVDAARAGAPVELLGPTLTVDAVGAACSTTGYEVLTRLGGRYARRVLPT